VTQPLALLPGLLNDAALWRHQIAALADRADCFVPDFTTQDSVAAMAETVLSALPGRFALAGLSMGGYAAFEILRRAPGRVARLALLDTKAGPDSAEQVARRRGLIALAEKGRFQGVTRRLLPLLIAEAHLANEALVAEVMAMAGRVGRDAFVRQQAAIMGRPDSRPILARIQCPTLVLCGRQDQLTPPDLHLEMAAGIRDARLVVLEDCGHLAPLEQPAAVTAALGNWLASD
jgi:pimeloyl-ACP methyl ester carboxylesterase